MSRIAARLTAGVLVSGALVAAAAMPASAADHRRHLPRPSVVLGKVQYDSPGADNRTNRSLNGEWVTVTNTSRSAVNLRGWTLRDADGARYTFELRLGGRQSVRVHTGAGRDTAHDVYQNRRVHVWDNTDTATLRDQRGRVVDSESWGRRHGGGRR
ncbi:lamin tail domain-containing protein [Streptomyces sp. NBC_01476]|uniref:lamin tail domain-containing protein n=1 Tax=Streptomyces sp. NBC_01476 TaxID=2903881 RepID=UPI002E3383FF|nr:lamin tail domain-containing protein [Streptomyces sp. NBC_01476]